jgi:hypothetical protein
VRLPRVVARAALIAALALIVVPGSAGSRMPSAPRAIDPQRFASVDLGYEMTAMTTLDPDSASDGRLEFDAVLREPMPFTGELAPRPNGALPANSPIVRNPWHLDSNISWYGPGFYGNNGACGMVPGGLTPDTVGVAHRTLPCGTKVTFRYNGVTVTTQVIDRGPYVGVYYRIG